MNAILGGATEPSDPDQLLRVEGLKKYFPVRGGVFGRALGYIRAVDGLSFSIRKGQTLGLIGESGSGKTTVGRCILRLIDPTDGHVTFRGKALERLPRPRLITLAAGILAFSVIVNVLVLLMGILAGPSARAVGLPDVVFLLVGAFAPDLGSGIQGAVAGWGVGSSWVLLSLVGLLGGAYAAGAALEAERPRPALLGSLLLVLSFQWVLGGLAVLMIVVAAKDFGKDTARTLRKDMQIVFQDPFGSLNPRMLVSRIVSEPLRAFRNEVADRYPVQTREGRRGLSEDAMSKILAELFARVGLNPEHLNRFPHEFSGGQRQRICVARALALKPAFIVLDEPTSALDVSVQAQILNLLKELQRERGLTYLFISHHLAVIRHMCDEIAVLYLGKIVEVAPNESLFKDTMHPYTIALLSAIPSVDPEARRERIVLEGEIPSPANPPSGCRFHTRCNFAMEREVAEVDALFDTEEDALLRLEDPLVASLTVRLVVGGEVIDPLASVGTVAYQVEEEPGEGVVIRVKAPLAQGAPVRIRYRRYREPCATAEPLLLEVEPSHKVACHFREEALEAHRRSEKEGRPIGAVIGEMRAPLPIASTVSGGSPLG